MENYFVITIFITFFITFFFYWMEKTNCKNFWPSQKNRLKSAFFLKLFQSDDSGEADCDESPLGRGGVLSASQECIRPRPYSALPNGRPQNHLSTNSVPLLTPQTKPTLSQIDPPTQQPRKEPRNKLKEVNVQNLGMMVINTYCDFV